MTAARVAELGLGVTLDPGQVTAGALRDALATVGGDSGYRSRVTRIQKAAHDAGGYLRTADVIRQFGHQRRQEKG
jgi:dTDP-L-oleandrosyltransferase